MRRILQWAFGLLVPIGALRLLHLTWLLVVGTVIAVVVVLVIQASRRGQRPNP